MEKNAKYKEFKPTSWAIDNKLSVYVLTISIAIFGIISYNSIPKEQFPEIIIPTIIVNTAYPGTSPSDMESLVTRPIEKNIKSINGVDKIQSKSVQDFSMVLVEFKTDSKLSIADAKQKVKDAVDKSRSELPNNLPADPNIMEIDLSQMPIMYINLSGDYTLDKLKSYAELLQERIEGFSEITRVDIVGALDREIQINVDMFKMQAVSLSFNDIDRAIMSENMTIAGGTIEMQGMRRSIRVVGEFSNLDAIRNITMKSSSGAIVRLSDVAEVSDSFKEAESFARMNGKNVITLNVIKKSGQNLLDASDKIKESIESLKKSKFPKELNVVITGDQSHFTRTTLADLNNTIIIGFILVTIVLMFFMGLTNAIFVGLSVPLSMALAYIVMPGIDFTMNMLVMFAFIFALGIVVDDAIVVIENTHRVFRKTGVGIVQSAKWAAGEVFLPILSGTLTTLAPFFPLAFWPGVVGKFMYFIPITLIITLFASLIVAYIINPIFAVSFMKHQDDEVITFKAKKIFSITAIIAFIGAIFHIASWHGMGNFMIFIAIFYLFHNAIGYKVIIGFQQRTLPYLLGKYEQLLHFALKGRMPYYLFYGTVLMLILSFVLVGIVKPKVVFFPNNDPTMVNIFIKLPVGTDVKVTDSIARVIEKKVTTALGENNPIVESVVTNIALGASENIFDSGTKTSNLAKITVNFVEFAKRKGANTQVYMDSIRENVKGIAGVEITVDKNVMGPPTGKAINIELSGDDMDMMAETAQGFMDYLDSLGVQGIEDLKSDFEATKPEIVIDIDRERANREGISTAQIGMEIRTAILGKETTKFREGEDQYPIQIRYKQEQRQNIDRLLNTKITYRDMTNGMLRQIPLSSVARIQYINTYGGINRLNVKRVITLSSNVLSGYTPNEVVAEITSAIESYPIPEEIEMKMTGEQEQQKDSMAFLSKAMLISLFMILFIMITQFKSISKPIIIVSEVLFSIIGVLLGYIIFGMTISIIMTGMGIVALAGIVVRNGILLVEFTDVLKERGMKTRDAIIQAGKTRIIPVMLTASATILGLIPLAIGFNIDFIGLFTHLEPHIHFGGDNVMFFGPLAWTIIFGLSFATFLTLVLTPVMYYMAYAGKVKLKRHKDRIVNKYTDNTVDE